MRVIQHAWVSVGEVSMCIIQHAWGSVGEVSMRVIQHAWGVSGGGVNARHTACRVVCPLKGMVDQFQEKKKKAKHNLFVVCITKVMQRHVAHLLKCAMGVVYACYPCRFHEP